MHWIGFLVSNKHCKQNRATICIRGMYKQKCFCIEYLFLYSEIILSFVFLSYATVDYKLPLTLQKKKCILDLNYWSLKLALNNF